MRLLYSILYLLVLPAVFPGQYLKRPPELRRLWLAHKLGSTGIENPDGAPLLWVHAVSVGEAMAATTFIKAFLAHRDYGDYRVIVSTITDTGRKVAQGRLGDVAEVIYLPFDIPGFLHKAIKALRPRLFVVMETEIWPNLFHCMKSNGVPVAMLNGRISQRSFKSYLKIRPFLRRAFDCVDAFSMQDDTYARRIIAMGASPLKVHSTGNFKFDISLEAKGVGWAGSLARPIVVVGSTHRGEEEIIAATFSALTKKREVSLILVPRHPERAQEVGEVLARYGIDYVRRSDILPGERAVESTVLVDTVGELTSIYREADIAVIGGSFIPHGGQNPLEPAYWSKPVVCGPYMHNFPFIDEFYDAGAALRADAETLGYVLEGLMDSEEKRTELGGKASALLEGKRGAVGRALDIVDTLLSKSRSVGAR